MSRTVHLPRKSNAPKTTGNSNLMDAPPSLTEADEILAAAGLLEEAAELVA